MKMVVFNAQTIRRVFHNDEWWFVIIDVIAAVTGSSNAAGYIKDMRRRDPELSQGWEQIATPLVVETRGGIQKLNCANTEGLFRIIQSIPSPKAEPFKRWLAKTGSQRIKEIEDPAILAAEICQATVGVTPSEYKALKNLKRDNLHDYIPDLDLIFSMLGEAKTSEE